MRAARGRVVEARAVAPRVRAQEQAALGGESLAEAAGREHERRLDVGRQRRLELDVARKQRGQRPRIEPLAGRERVLGVLPHRLGAERYEPVERVVQPLPDEPLQRRVAAGALGAEVVPLEVPPDDAAREQHRAAGARSLLDQPRREPELARARGAHEPGHASACDRAIRKARTSACARRTRSGRCSGPQRNTAYVFGASTTSSISTPRSFAAAMCSSADSTSTARWLSSGRSGLRRARRDGTRRRRRRPRRAAHRTHRAARRRSRATRTRRPSPPGCARRARRGRGRTRRLSRPRRARAARPPRRRRSTPRRRAGARLEPGGSSASAASRSETRRATCSSAPRSRGPSASKSVSLPRRAFEPTSVNGRSGRSRACRGAP